MKKSLSSRRRAVSKAALKRIIADQKAQLEASSAELASLRIRAGSFSSHVTNLERENSLHKRNVENWQKQIDAHAARSRADRADWANMHDYLHLVKRELCRYGTGNPDDISDAEMAPMLARLLAAAALIRPGHDVNSKPNQTTK